MQLDGSWASPPDDTALPVSALELGMGVFVARLASGPEMLDRRRLDEIGERALPWIEAEDVPLEVGLLLLERVVLALLAEEPTVPEVPVEPAPRQRCLRVVT